MHICPSVLVGGRAVPPSHMGYGTEMSIKLILSLCSTDAIAFESIRKHHLVQEKMHRTLLNSILSLKYILINECNENI